MECLYNAYVLQSDETDIGQLPSPSIRKAAKLPRLASARVSEADFLVTEKFESLLFQSCFKPFVIETKKARSLQHGNRGKRVKLGGKSAHP
jgi:hypothetical protein